MEISSNGVSPSADGHITWDRNLYSINVRYHYYRDGIYGWDFYNDGALIYFYEGETWEYIIKFPKAHPQQKGISNYINSDGIVCYKDKNIEY